MGPGGSTLSEKYDIRIGATCHNFLITLSFLLAVRKGFASRPPNGNRKFSK